MLQPDKLLDKNLNAQEPHYVKLVADNSRGMLLKLPPHAAILRASIDAAQPETLSKSLKLHTFCNQALGLPHIFRPCCIELRNKLFTLVIQLLFEELPDDFLVQTISLSTQEDKKGAEGFERFTQASNIPQKVKKVVNFSLVSHSVRVNFDEYAPDECIFIRYTRWLHGLLLENYVIYGRLFRWQPSWIEIIRLRLDLLFLNLHYFQLGFLIEFEHFNLCSCLFAKVARAKLRFFILIWLIQLLVKHPKDTMLRQKFLYLCVFLTVWFILAPNKVKDQNGCLSCRCHSIDIQVLFRLLKTITTADHLTLNENLLWAYLVEI